MTDPSGSGAVFVVTGAGLYRRRPGDGSFWLLGSSSFPGTVLAIDPSNPRLMYSAVGEYSGFPDIFQSVDGGFSWHVIARLDSPVRDILVDSVHGVVYALAGSGLHKSLDGGVRWTLVGASSPVFDHIRLAPVTCSALYGISGGSLLTSTDGGASWSAPRVPPGAHLVDIIVSGATSPTVYALGGYVYSTTDNGLTWRPISGGALPPSFGAISADPGDWSHAFAPFGFQGITVTRDRGNSWFPINLSTVLPLASINAVSVNPSDGSDILVGGDVFIPGPAIARSSDGGTTWEPLAGPPYSRTIERSAPTPTTIFADSYAPGTFTPSLWKSTDDGLNWSRTGYQHTGDAIASISTDPTSSDRLYLAAGGVWRSTDGGATWSAASGINGSTKFVVADRLVSGVVWAGSAGDLFKSTDGGTTFLGQPSPASGISLAQDTAHPGTYFADGRWVTTDGGLHWAELPGSPNGGLVDVSVDPTGRYLYGTLNGNAAYETAMPAAIPPQVFSVAPWSGSIAGGDRVEISGDRFVSGMAVRFGGALATNVWIRSSKLALATTPAHAGGPVEVVASDVSGSSSPLWGGFEYLPPAPVIRSVSPSSGPEGSAVTLTGSFSSASSVSFGSIPSDSFRLIDGSTIIARAPGYPPLDPTVDISVTDDQNQAGWLPRAFTFTGQIGGGRKFFTIAPCRLIDTRRGDGPYGGPALAGDGSSRDFWPAFGSCPIPADAVALAANATAIQPRATGVIWIGSFPFISMPDVSTLDFRGGRTRANNLIVGLNRLYDPSLYPLYVQASTNDGSPVDFALDVVGYFR